MGNGTRLEINSIVFQPRFDNWSMRISTAELEEPTDIITGDQAVHLTKLPQEMGVGTYEMGIDESGGGFFQIAQPDDPESTTSWNTSMAYVLEITEWTAGEYDPEARMFQEAGKASGRVVAVFRGSGDFENSYAVGTFEDAVVRYMGKPRWFEEEEEEGAEAAE